ncbi:MAG: stage 0 sporulation family protein, partial [Dehalococcoidia bacterium]
MAEQQRVPAGIRFKEAGKIYYFDARGYELDVGNYVVVDTSHGQEVGRVVIAPDQVIVSEIKESLKPIVRMADDEDLARAEEAKKRSQEHLAVVRSRAIDDGLDMRVAGGEYNLEGSQLTVYFTADERVDFRTLARDMSSELDTKVQLLQVGDRDRAKIVDGIGRCGERLCCSSWLTTFPNVSIKMAKDQDLPVNPSKLSGACGRLLCCLTYEYDQYRDLKGSLPKVGAKVSTPTGEARVLKINVPKETMSLFITETSERIEMPIDQFRLMYGTAIRPKELTQTFEKELMATEQGELPTPTKGDKSALAEAPMAVPEAKPKAEGDAERPAG